MKWKLRVRDEGGISQLAWWETKQLEFGGMMLSKSVGDDVRPDWTAPPQGHLPSRTEQ